MRTGGDGAVPERATTNRAATFRAIERQFQKHV